MAEEIKRIRMSQDTEANYQASPQKRLAGELARLTDKQQIAVGDGSSAMEALRRVLLFDPAKAENILAALEGNPALGAGNPVMGLNDTGFVRRSVAANKIFVDPTPDLHGFTWAVTFDPVNERPPSYELFGDVNGTGWNVLTWGRDGLVSQIACAVHGTTSGRIFYRIRPDDTSGEWSQGWEQWKELASLPANILEALGANSELGAGNPVAGVNDTGFTHVFGKSETIFANPTPDQHGFRYAVTNGAEAKGPLYELEGLDGPVSWNVLTFGRPGIETQIAVAHLERVFIRQRYYEGSLDDYSVGWGAWKEFSVSGINTPLMPTGATWIVIRDVITLPDGGTWALFTIKADGSYCWAEFFAGGSSVGEPDQRGFAWKVSD